MTNNKNESLAPVLTMLWDAKRKAQEVIDVKILEVAKLDKAIAAMSDGDLPEGHDPSKGAAEAKNPMLVGDAIVMAVERGHKTPAAIFEYLTEELGVQTTIGSVRARLSPLKTEGKVAHDGKGWVPANHIEAEAVI